MSNPKIAALNEGTNYQSLVFWKYAFKMLLPNSDIALVQYEKSELEPCDDVVVCYKKNLIEDDINCVYSADYIQCKFKVSNENKIKYEDLLDPEYYGNKESFLFRAYKLYSSLEDKNVRIILYSTVLVDSNDKIFNQISNVNHALRVDSLFKDRRKEVKSALEKSIKHIGVNVDEFKDFLLHIRFNFGRSIEEERDQVKNICGQANIKYDRSQTGDNLNEILRRMNLSSRTDFDVKSIRKICTDNDLFIKKENYIGVISYLWGDDKAKRSQSYGENVLDLTEYFEGRILKKDYSWGDVISEIRKFCNNKIRFGENYIFNLSSIYSVCFALGKQIGFKIAKISFENRVGLFDKDLAGPCLITDEIEQYNDNDKEDIDKDNAILTLSFNGCILEDVKTYVAEFIPNSRIYSEVITSPTQNINNNMFWAEIDAFCKGAWTWLKSCKPKYIHIFYRGPAEGAFVIGQYAKEWGECTIYEFAFGALLQEQK